MSQEEGSTMINDSESLPNTTEDGPDLRQLLCNSTESIPLPSSTSSLSSSLFPSSSSSSSSSVLSSTLSLVELSSSSSLASSSVSTFPSSVSSTSSTPPNTPVPISPALPNNTPHHEEPPLKKPKPNEPVDLKQLSEPYALPFTSLIKDCTKGTSPSVKEELRGEIEFKIIQNLLTPSISEEDKILITGLKNIFQKQLPKMPREYIAKLVFDPSHISMCLIKTSDQSVLGGICFRPFYDRKFVEIVFCAITSTEQVKGYGSHLMNHLKDYVQELGDLRHFLTYADNYAIGYFQKQGFTTDITLEKSIWMGYIKDYEGGTIMQCTMVPKVKYLQVYEILKQQKTAIYMKICQLSKSHVVYPGLTHFQTSKQAMDPMIIPGVAEAGWTPERSKERAKKAKSTLYILFTQLLDELRGHANAWPFMEPVDTNLVKDYYDVIKNPMDLQTLESLIESDHYPSIAAFTTDVQKIFDNCRKYNDLMTPYYKSANKLEKFFYERLKILTEREVAITNGLSEESVAQEKLQIRNQGS